jgi:hypothetical protein
MKDKRYITIGKLIQHNEIKLFRDILDTVPKTPLARDLGIKPERMNKILDSIEMFTLQELFRLADLCEADRTAVVALAINQYEADKKNKRKK